MPTVEVVPDEAQEANESKRKWRKKAPMVEKYKLPVTTESIDTKEIDERVNLITVEDSIKYMPSIEVRKRYSGDTNEPMGTRTASLSQSARTMIFADGILLSTYLNNNNTNTGSPRWNTVAPGELERSDMMYGPFSAQYAGNSMGGVLVMTTKMPTKFVAGVNAMGAFGTYDALGASGDTNAQNYAMYVGDKLDDFSFRFDYNHLYSLSQPIGYSTVVQAVGTRSSTGIPVQGAVPSYNSYGAPMYVLGVNNGQYATTQDNMKLKLAYDITDTIRLSYTIGLWLNNQDAEYSSYLTTNGNSFTGGSGSSNSSININGNLYTGSQYSIFSPVLAHQQTWSHGITLKSETGGAFDWELVGSIVNLGVDTSRTATVPPTAAASATTGYGRSTILSGSNWYTVDGKGIYRVDEDLLGHHEVSFGFHNDSYELNNPVYTTNNWQNGSPTAINGANSNIYQNAQGQTMTQGYWIQDSLDFNKEWNFTLGGRLEHWDAYNGVNQTMVGTTLQTVNQQDQQSTNFSPKVKLTWNPSLDWRIGAAFGEAWRYPTVGEPFQTSTVGTSVYNANPNLRPEQAFSSELSNEYFMENGKARLSFFSEAVNNAIYSVSTLMSNGTVSNTTQNVPSTNIFGAEFSGEMKDVIFKSLNLYGTATYAHGRIGSDPAADAANIAAATPTALLTNPGTGMPVSGAVVPRIPEWRSSFTVSYSPLERMTTSVSGRYSSQTFSQLNNSDVYHNTYVGNSAYFVLDLKVNYKIDDKFTFNAGIDNVTNKLYWLYHPFPQRTFVAQLKYDW
ncbi:TonB-dependent receptor [Candidatus Methylospira mobilis]|nr:TonB-dependent receptor [Candidatus Methylospira mobilis]